MLCAREIQPAADAFRGSLVRCPIPDAILTPREVTLALSSGRVVAESLLAGRQVLVTCAAGKNRSALVAGLALGLATTMTPIAIITLIRQRRSPDCLSNKHFVEVLERYLRRQ